MVGRAAQLALVLLALLMAGCSGSDGEGAEGDDAAGDGEPTSAASTQPDTETAAPTPTTGTTSSTGTTGPSSSSSPSSASQAPRPAETFDVDIQGNDFVDGSITVQKGDTVRWTQNDVVQHTVTADGGAFDSGNLLITQTYSFVFDAAGSFPYHCDIHPGMTDAITVVEAPSA